MYNCKVAPNRPNLRRFKKSIEGAVTIAMENILQWVNISSNTTKNDQQMKGNTQRLELLFKRNEMF